MFVGKACCGYNCWMLAGCCWRLNPGFPSNSLIRKLRLLCWGHGLEVRKILHGRLVLSAPA